jgi:hypothetical protein
MSSTILRIVLATVCLFVGQSLAYAQDWHDTYNDPSTLGGALEARFTTLLTNCGAFPLRKNTTTLFGAVREGPVISSIPKSVQTNFNLQQKISSGVNRSTGQVFAYVYRQSDTLGSLSIDPSRLITDSNYTQDPVSMLLQGGTSTLYSSSCGSVVNAAASLNAGWSIPVASAKAALSSDYSSNVKSTIAVTQGYFHSPLYALWSSPDATQRVFAGFLFWQWYVNHPNELPVNNFYLTDFQGVSLYGLATTQTSSDINLSASAGVSTPFVSLNSSLQTALNQQTYLSNTDNYTYIFAPQNAANPWGDFAQLPSPTDIAGAALNITTQKTTTSSIVSKGQVTDYSQLALGIPKDFCSTTQWDTDYTNQNGPLVIASATSGIDNSSSEPTCTFLMEYTPADGLFSPGATPQVISQNYHLRLKHAIGGVSLLIAAAPVAFSTSISPILSASSDNSPRWKVNSENVVASTTEHDYSLGWTIKYQINDSGDPVAGVDQNVQMTMACPAVQGITIPIPSKSIQFDATGKTVTISLTSNIFNAPATINADDVSSFVTCTISGVLNFQMVNPSGGGRVIPKGVGEGISLQFPAPKPQPITPVTQPSVIPASQSTAPPASSPPVAAAAQPSSTPPTNAH